MEWAINFYYDLTDHKKHTFDPEGNLVQLCTDCAEDINELAARTRQPAELELASAGDADCICESCGENQWGAYTALAA